MSERPKIILVYQMGKVGSQSIAHALMTAGFRERTVADSTDVGPVRDCVIHIHHHDQVAAFLAKTQSEIKFVTGMRRIIDRNIAAFFHNCHNEGNRYWYFGPPQVVQATPAEELIEFFRPRNINHTREVVLPWFDRFGHVTGLRPLAQRFSRDALFMRLSTAHRDALIYRVEDLPYLWDVISDFVGTSIKPIRRNVSTEKWYGAKSNEFRQLYVPSREELDVCERNDLIEFFYGEGIHATA